MADLLRKLLGDRGERAAGRFLRREKKMRILARQFSTRWGEMAYHSGMAAETCVAQDYERRGYGVARRRWRGKGGEVDLIMRDGPGLIFVEVKTRKSDEHGHPTEAVTRTKQQHLTKAALYWLKKKGLLERRTRFDVVSVVWPDDSRTPTIQHFVNAFEAADLGQLY